MVGDEDKNPRNRECVQEIEVFGPNFLLRADAVIVDTPGLSAYSYDHHETLTLQTFLPTVDLVVFVITAKANSDAQIRGYLGDISQAGKPVILVQNMIDTVEPKLGVGCVVLRTREEVALELKVRAQRIAREALGVDSVAVHQVAALRAASGDLPRSGIGDLARAIELELDRLAPRLNAGRLGQLRAELSRNLPKETAAEETAALEAEATQLRFHRGEVARVRAWTGTSLVPAEGWMVTQANAILGEAGQVGQHDVSRAFEIRETHVPTWSQGTAGVLHDYAGKLVSQIKAVATGIGLSPDDYLIPAPQAGDARSVRVQTWDDSWTETREQPGFWGSVKRFFGAGGHDLVVHQRQAMDTEAFVADVHAALQHSLTWFRNQRARLVDHGEQQLVRLDLELNRQEEALLARRAIAGKQQARQRVRRCIADWIVHLDALIAAGNAALPGEAARSACAPFDAMREVTVPRPALDLLLLGDLVARRRYAAARAVVLERAARVSGAVGAAALVGWDRHAMEDFVSRFWSDCVEGTLDKSVTQIRLAGPVRRLLIVDESDERIDVDYQHILGAGLPATVLFLVLDVMQPGATESTLSRERLLFKVRFGAVCLVIQSLVGFRRADDWAAEDLVEALDEVDRIVRKWSVQPIAVLANDDDIGVTALVDRLLVGPAVTTIAQEQVLIRDMDGLMKTSHVADIVAAWRALRSKPRATRSG